MELNSFRALFQDSSMRAWLDWDRLTPEDHSIQIDTVTSLADLGRLLTPWYVNDLRGVRSDWRDRNGRRLSVGQAADYGALGPTTESRLAELTARPELLGIVDPIIIPCVLAEPERRIVLDGNHRAIAAYRLGRAPRLLLATLVGVHSPLVIPDLVHEIVPIPSADEWERLTRQIDVEFGD